MDAFKQENLLQTEAQVSDELSGEDLEVVNGGFKDIKDPSPGFIEELKHLSIMDDVPNITRHIWPRR
jgi:hypothetical protein